jgi:hypothetical protein
VRPRLLTGAALAALVAAAPSSAYGQTQAQCHAVLLARDIPPGSASDHCNTLAGLVASTARRVLEAAEVILRDDDAAVGAIFSQRDLQPRYPQLPSLAGTPAQGHAIPGVQPAAMAAGAIAVVGTDAGDDAIAALGLNPLVVLIADEVSRQLARYSRTADLTVFVPVSDLSTEDADAVDRAKPRYFGARLRLNVTGVAAGDRVWDGARRLIRNWIVRGGKNLVVVRQAFARATDLTACVRALLDTTATAASAAAGCGGPVELEVDLREAEELRARLAEVRSAADARYFGADIRLDVGDPTLGAVPNSEGRSLFAGLAYGRRLQGAGNVPGSTGIRARLGARHATLDFPEATELALEGGLGFEFARRFELQEINAASAVEFRYGDSPANLTDQFQTNFVMLRGSFVLPVAAGYNVSINVGVPLAGDVSRILSVNFNWGLLLPDSRPR